MRKNYTTMIRIIILLICILGINCDYNVNAKEMLPKIIFAGTEHSPLIEGESQTIYLQSQYDKEVQYRVIQNKVGTNIWSDISNGYMKPVKAYSVQKILCDQKYSKGTYKILIFVKVADKKGGHLFKNIDYDDMYTINQTCVKKDKTVYVNTSGDINIAKGKYVAKDTIYINGIKDISGMKEPYLYKLHIYDVNKKKWIMDSQPYRSNLEWSPLQRGEYILNVWVMPRESKLWEQYKNTPLKMFEGWRLKKITVEEPIRNEETVVEDDKVNNYEETLKPVDNAINLDNSSEKYGSDDKDKPMIVSRNIKVNGKDVMLKNLEVNGDILIKGKNVCLINVKIHGNLVIDPGNESGANLYRVEADNIEVFSLSTKGNTVYDSLYLKSIKSKKLVVNSRNSIEPITICLKGRSTIEKTEIKSNIILDYEDGFNSAGKIEILPNIYGQKILLQLKGSIYEEISVKCEAAIKVFKDFKVSKVIVQNINNENISLEGRFGEVRVDTRSSIILAEKGYIDKCDIYRDTRIQIDKDSVISEVKTNDCSIILSGEGMIIFRKIG